MRETIVCVWMLAAATAMTVAGCDMSASSTPAECRVLGAQCRLASGPLGVCENVACESGDPGPCFLCVDQH